MDKIAIVGRLRARADRCGSLAEQASDSEVAEALRQVADDIELALRFLESAATKGNDSQP